MLYQGWPAQEGGTDSNREASSSSDIFLPREVVAHGVTSARPEVPLPPRVPWPNRYPAWWTEMSVPEPTPKAKASSPTEAEAQPTARCPTTSKAAAAAATEPAATEPTACAPAATTVATQTQTSVTRATVASRPARSPLMPCMRNAPPSRKKAPTAKPRVESIVALQLRREAAYRKQLAAARRRRLEAVVSGLDLDEETAISSEERGAANRVRARSGHAWVVGSDAAESESEGVIAGRHDEAPLDGARVASDARGVASAADSTVEQEVEAALDAAMPGVQHFLGSALGRYFAGSRGATPAPITDSVDCEWPHESDRGREAQDEWDPFSPTALPQLTPGEGSRQTGSHPRRESMVIHDGVGYGAERGAGDGALPITANGCLSLQHGCSSTGQAMPSKMVQVMPPAEAWEVDISALRKPRHPKEAKQPDDHVTPKPASPDQRTPTPRAQRRHIPRREAHLSPRTPQPPLPPSPAPPAPDVPAEVVPPSVVPPPGAVLRPRAARERPDGRARRSHAGWVGDFSKQLFRRGTSPRAKAKPAKGATTAAVASAASDAHAKAPHGSDDATRPRPDAAGWWDQTI